MAVQHTLVNIPEFWLSLDMKKMGKYQS